VGPLDLNPTALQELIDRCDKVRANLIRVHVDDNPRDWQYVIWVEKDKAPSA
jgi:hypothetical protein